MGHKASFVELWGLREKTGQQWHGGRSGQLVALCGSPRKRRDQKLPLWAFWWEAEAFPHMAQVREATARLAVADTLTGEWNGAGRVERGIN